MITLDDAHNGFVTTQKEHTDIIVRMPLCFEGLILGFSLSPIKVKSMIVGQSSKKP